MPVHNGERFVGDAIASVQSQDFQLWELLVIDDGSSDRTKAIVEQAQLADPRIRYAKNDENLGIQKTLNKGIAMARGQYIARIDYDDRWIEHDKLSRQVGFLDAHDDYALVGTGMVVVDEQGNELSRVLNPETDQAIRSRILGKNCFTHSSVLFRTDAVKVLGGYSESSDVRHMEDYELWLRMGVKHKFANLPLYGVAWMLRQSSVSGTYKYTQFKNDIAVAAKYRDKYPGYWAGLLRNCARLVLYGMLGFIPFLSAKYAAVRVYAKLFRRSP